MHRIVRDVSRALKKVPHAYRAVLRDPTEFIAAGIALNLLWGAYMFFVEGFIVGFTVAAIISLRLSAVIWNFAFGPYAASIEAELGGRWHKSVRRGNPLLLPFRAVRWYIVAIGISLISQVPIQAAAYPMAIYVFGHATWDGLLPLTLAEWQSWELFLRNSWFPIAVLFSPILGPIFSPVTAWIERHIKTGAKVTRRQFRPSGVRT